MLQQFKASLFTPRASIGLLILAVAILAPDYAMHAALGGVFFIGDTASLSLVDLKALREKRFKLVHDAQEILKKDVLTAEDEARFDGFMKEADGLKGRIDREERAQTALAELEQPQRRNIDLGAAGDPDADAGDPDRKKQAVAFRQAFWTWFRDGAAALTPEQRGLMNRRRSEVPAEFRAAQTVTTSGGGYTVDTELVPNLELAMKSYGGLRSVATVLKTAGGNPLTYPTMDDTGNKAVLTSINTATSETALTFGQKQLDAYAFKSLILVPFELLQDSAINLEQYVTAALAERIYRGTADYFATGSGSSQPQGIVGAATAGWTAAASGAITFDDIIELEHSVDPAYRLKASFAMADVSLKIIKKLKDSQNRPLWLPGLAVKEPDTINQYPYVIDQALPGVSSGDKSMVFGDLSKYMIRDVAEMIMLRLTERFAEFAQVGFLVFSRHDGELMDAGQHPVKYMVMPSP